MNYHKVKNVIPLRDYMLFIQFEDGTNKKYDVKPLFSKWSEFKALTDIKGLFEQVKVDQGGYGIVWNDYIDLSCEELYNNGIIQQQAVDYDEYRQEKAI